MCTTVLQVVTVGIAYTSPNLTVPDVMLLARPAVSCAVYAKNDQHTRERYSGQQRTWN